MPGNQQSRQLGKSWNVGECLHESDPTSPQRGNAWQLNQFTTNRPSFNAKSSLFLLWMFPNDVFYSLNTPSGSGLAAMGWSRRLRQRLRQNRQGQEVQQTKASRD